MRGIVKGAVIGAAALALAASALADQPGPAERAVEAAKAYSGTTLTITWEAGLQALDPLNFSGPLWEELTGIRIIRDNHFASDEYKARWPEAPAYLATLEQAAETGLLDLSILQTASYVEALGRAIQAAISGVDPQAALDQAAAEWDALTRQIGVDAQRAAYQDWASKPNAYPER